MHVAAGSLDDRGARFGPERQAPCEHVPMFGAVGAVSHASPRGGAAHRSHPRMVFDAQKAATLFEGQGAGLGVIRSSMSGIRRNGTGVLAVVWLAFSAMAYAPSHRRIDQHRIGDPQLGGAWTLSLPLWARSAPRRSSRGSDLWLRGWAPSHCEMILHGAQGQAGAHPGLSLQPAIA